MEKRGKVIAVIPAYNEEKYIKSTLDNIRKNELIDELLVVDDGSEDNTSIVVKNMGIKFIKLNENHGKGYAIKKAISQIDYEYLILIDGDLGKTSSEVNKLIYPVINGEVDVTIAKFKKAKRKGGFGLVKGLAKYGVYFLTGKIINTTLSGQRVYRREVVEKISYIPDRFGVEIAMTVGTLRNGFNIKEIDVDMTHRETGRNLSGFIHRGKQFFDILITLIKLLFRR